MDETPKWTADDFPLHAHLPWEDLGPVDLSSDTCRYCGAPVRKAGSVACNECRGTYIALRRKALAQTARLIELARQRKAGL